MLEVKNLKKIYKTKNGAPVHALDGISMRFPEKGMVFLLGKSGSGKSTLLNVCGGLDSPTEGEVIVKGRSSKDFSQSDFDSYRNTFIGFIFQEYNILNEFSVEDNIALALELQGKSKDKEAIAALLEQVDLTGYAKRKPNTLSGGQKQRIAIARALVKKPEIIMADEPTGALDSNTGKQVFDTLKKLSKDKLVIVVSHDREFAEQYGDRIIELKDGQILSDVSKTHAEAETVSENMSVLGDVLCIKKGADLSENDFENIKKFLKKSQSDVVIATDEKSVKTFKTAARITDRDEMEVFRQTDPEKTPQKQYTKEESRFIRSKLPLRHAFKIGTSSLKYKPIRLFFTILLCSVAFILFGMLSTLNFYDSEATFFQTLRDSDISAINLRKDYTGKVTWFSYGEEQHSFDSWYEARFSNEDLTKLAQELNPDAFGGLTNMGGSFNLQQVTGQYWQNYVASFNFLPEASGLRGKIQGAYPANANEIVISSYFANMFVACKGYDADGLSLELNEPAELIGKTISLSSVKYKITGILDTGVIPEKFDVLKENNAQEDYALLQEFQSAMDGSLHYMVFVSEERMSKMIQEYWSYKEGRDNYMRITASEARGGEYTFPDYSNAQYNGISTLATGQKLYPITKDGTDLQDNEILLPSNHFATFLGNMFSFIGENYSQKEDYDRADKYYQLSDKAWQLYNGGISSYNEETKEDTFTPYTEEQYDSMLSELLTAAKKEKLQLKIAIRLFDDMNQTAIGETLEYEIVGIYKHTDDRQQPIFYLSDTQADALWDQQKSFISDYSEMETNYVPGANELYNTIYLPGNVPEEKIASYWEVYQNDEFGADSTRLVMGGGIVYALQRVDYMVESFSQIFLYVGLVLAVFAALLLSNFISVSISNKKREIGILRAVGARSNDVFKIFFSESFVIGLICVILSSVASFMLCGWINEEYAVMLGASVFVFGPMSIGVLVAIAFATIVIATFLPVYQAANKKPVDSIRAI